MSKFKKYFLPLIIFCCCITTHAQNNQWLLGEWKGVGIIPGSAYSTIFLRTLVINTEDKNKFTGLLVQEVMNNKTIRIEKKISGSIINDNIKIITGKSLYVKQPAHGFWADCSACKMNSTRITVSSDSLILTNETRLCGNYCDGYATYYKALADFDTSTQKKLVQQFGSPLLVKIFKPIVRDNKYNNELIAKNANTVNDTIQNQLGRKNKTLATYNITSTDIKVELYDNGEIDGDSVTVYHNKEMVIDRQMLGLKPIVFSVKADAQNRVHEFILVANNLGRVPPNTALMRITAGSKTYELFASTNLQENASVVIIYSGQ